MGKEKYFERRLQKILEKKRYLVINLPETKYAGQLFDLILMKDGITFLGEVKGSKTWHPQSQHTRQIKMAMSANIPFVVIRQSKKRGKMKITTYGASEKQRFMLMTDLREHLEFEVR